MKACFPASDARLTMILGRLLLGCLVGLALFANEAVASEPQTLTRVAGMPLAKDFSLKDMNGKSYRLSDFRGKVVLVNFWATWCPPCREELPSLERLWKMLNHKKFEILAVNLGQGPDAIFGFTGALNPALTFPILLDRSTAVFKSWSGMAIPTTFVVNQEGRIVYRAVGGRRYDDPHIVKQIKTLATTGK
ncbi:MAG TPA: alkyl hydroperoxide reductase [Betaproteobacteria bacterium]|nr:alkyl hydroperoxide reductase [Betaproteobacteria bacterium]